LSRIHPDLILGNYFFSDRKAAAVSKIRSIGTVATSDGSDGLRENRQPKP
jgi:hypothetical protein